MDCLCWHSIFGLVTQAFEDKVIYFGCQHVPRWGVLLHSGVLGACWTLLNLRFWFVHDYLGLDESVSLRESCAWNSCVSVQPGKAVHLRLELRERNLVSSHLSIQPGGPPLSLVAVKVSCRPLGCATSVLCSHQEVHSAFRAVLLHRKPSGSPLVYTLQPQHFSF